MTSPAAPPASVIPRHATDESLRHARAADQGRATTTALRVLGVASLVLSLSTETVPFALAFHQASAAAGPGLGLLLASQLLAAVALLLPRHHRASPWVLLVALCGGVALMMRHTNGFDAARLLVPGYWIFPLVALSMRSRRRRDYCTFAGFAAVAMMLVQYRFVGTNHLADLADHLWIIHPVLLVLLFGDAIIAIDRARSLAVERSHSAAQDKRQLETEDLGQQAADQLLDGQLLPALRRLGEGDDPQGAQEAAQVAWHRVQQAVNRRRTAQIETMIQTNPALHRVDLRVSGATSPVPTALAEAMADATETYLVGLGQPAGSAHVTVRQQGDRNSVVVVNPDADPRQMLVRLGHGHEIFQRMDDVGGQASVTAHADGGSELTLRWPRVERSGPAAWAAAPNQLVRRKLTRTAWPTLTTGALMTPFAMAQLSNPFAALVCGLVLLVVGVATAVVLRRRALPLPALLTLVGLAVLVWLTNLWLVPQSPYYDSPLWTAWGASALVHLVVLSTRLSVGTLITTVWAAIQLLGIAVRYDGLMTLWDHSFLVITGAGDVIITLLVLWVARSSATQEADAARTASQLREAATRLQMSSGMQQQWSTLVTERAVPLLRKVSEGTADPTDPRVQADARWTVQLLRRERSALFAPHG